MINGQSITITQKTIKQTEDLMLSGPLTSTEKYVLEWEMFWQDDAPFEAYL